LLSKPCDPMVLKAVLARAFAAQDFVSHDAFQNWLGSITSLPVLPRIYNELMHELKLEEHCSLERAGLIVARDMGLSAKILQLVNSAFFGLGRVIGHPSEAAVFLGSETLRGLVLSLQVFSQFQQLKLVEFSVENLWKHSWTTGVLAKKLCEFEDAGTIITDEAFMSGLLHDVGKLVLAANFPVRLEENIRLARERQHTLWEQEFKVWGASHAELGAHLLSRWGLPPAVIEAVAFHHRPAQARCQTFCAVTAVHVANTLGRPPAPLGQLPQQSVDLDYLRGLGLTDRLESWRQMLQEAARR
jgi:putative nucleotidyltransferase with HDIG domain